MPGDSSRRSWDIRCREPAIGVAVNTAHSRTQDQYHIHIECLRQDVYDSLHAVTQQITETWSTVTVAGSTYSAMKIQGDGLDGSNPYELLAKLNPDVRVIAWVTTPWSWPAHNSAAAPASFYTDGHRAHRRITAGLQLRGRWGRWMNEPEWLVIGARIARHRPNRVDVLQGSLR